MEFVSTKLKVNALKFAETRGDVSAKLKFNETEELTMLKNDIITLNKLKSENFSALKRMVLINCYRVCFYNVGTFVEETKNMESLEIIDCDAYDKGFLTQEFLETVFSKKCHLSKLVFKYTKEQSKITTRLYQPFSQTQAKLTYLDLTNNVNLGHLLPNFLQNTPVLQTLKIAGLPIENITFAFHTSLKEVEVNHSPNISNFFATIFSCSFQKLTIISLHSLNNRKKNKLFQLDSLQSLFNRVIQFECSLFNCRISRIPYWMLELEQAKRLTVEIKHEKVTIKKK